MRLRFDLLTQGLVLGNINQRRKTKELLTEVMIDLLKTKRDILYDVVLEALEEVGLANAIAEGREDEFVSEDEVFSILDNGAK